jgi:hypothetical protein
MSCSRFKKEGHLFLANELDTKTYKAFQSHLAQCTICQQMLKEAEAVLHRVEKMPKLKPNKSVQKAILRASRKSHEKISIVERIFPNPRLTWSLSAVAVAVILVFILVRPFGDHSSEQAQQPYLLTWNDNFYAEADWMNQELDRVGSGNLLTHYFTYTEDQSDEDMLDSIISSDLDWIKNKVVDLAKTIYGI